MKPKVSIVLPVYNEEKVLEDSVKKILDFVKGMDEYNTEIVIADNASRDKTLEVAKRLSENFKNVRYIHLDQKGRGRALRKAWSESNADIMCYMDIDLSTDLEYLPRLVNAIRNGYDVATGSRLIAGANVERSLKREILSRGYNLLLKIFLNVGFLDAQCGFKAINRKVVREVIPKIKDQEWFFDTELLVRAERSGLRVVEIPVRWSEGRDSKVHIFKTVSNYIKSVMRLRRELS